MKEVFSWILLVDDDPVSRAINSLVIKDLGLVEKVDTAKNGLEGIEALKSFLVAHKPPEKSILVLLDLMMPVMDGFEFLEVFNLLQIKKDVVKVCVLSSSSHHDDLEKVRNMGVSWYMEKPMTEVKVMQLISLINENEDTRKTKALRFL
jgi:CheY-like chemotaxis protein